jgi:1,4-alpha-glucan branching enzyme
MLEKIPDATGTTTTVRFSLHADGFELPVCVAGDFNDWAEDQLAMHIDGDEHLQATVVLPRGERFEFRYHDARGRWFNDPEADDYAANEWGGMNGVVTT